MVNFWKVVNKVIRDADVLLMLLDARLVSETINSELESKVKNSGKPLIYVITKCDLVEDRAVLEKLKKKLNPCVFVSSKKFYGTTMLRDRILIEAKKKDIVKVGVLGYPNVGKSSLINSMSGRSAASTSIMSGHTRGVQKVKSDNKIMFLDTPGVIPYGDDDKVKHSLIGSIDFTKTKDPDMVVMELMKQFPGRIEKYYDVEVDDFEESIETIALKKKLVRKNGEPDIDRVSRLILKNWQKGLI